MLHQTGGYKDWTI